MIKIIHGDTQAFARIFQEICFPGNIRKFSVAIVMEQKVRGGLKLVRVTVGFGFGLRAAAPDIHREIPGQIAGNKKIKFAVAIIVLKEGPSRPPEPAVLVSAVASLNVPLPLL